ncbi:MAG TPA: methyltransferase domain-containing protein [Solirubrobacteraceae bacterium]|nr:methyltransferase domain-containing protein [Solirubrobacteraceae bacterium]
MSPEQAAWQRAEIAEEFLQTRQAVLPLIDMQEELVRLLFERRQRGIATFLDLGSGDGAMSQLMRTVAPEASAVLVDFSEPMLARAESRLGTGGWQAVQGDLSIAGWQRDLPSQSFDAVVSAYAIHHLTSERKRELFVEIHSLLAPGGMCVNMDVVRITGPLDGLFDERIAEAHGEIAHDHASASPGEDTFGDSAEDRPDPLEDQLTWLREAGFEQVEVHFKWAEGTIFGAVKPS